MPSKNYTLFFIFSVGFVLISIAFITILGQTSKKDNGNVDIRAKATVANSLKLVGTVSEVNAAERTMTVENIKFESKQTESATMGTWVVKQPTDGSANSISTGRKVLISADAGSFNTSAKTMTALTVAAQ